MPPEAYLNDQTRGLLPRGNSVREDIAEALCEISAHIYTVTAVR